MVHPMPFTLSEFLDAFRQYNEAVWPAQVVRYPASPTFGLPCPTTIFTLGMLLVVRPVPPLRTLALPAPWVVVATMAALRLDMREDLGLLPALAVVAAVAARAHRRPSLTAARTSPAVQLP